MAKIYPERLPESVLNDPKRAAERKLYEALADLSEKFRVFYSVAWQAVDRNSNVRDGEADFVVAHPDLGVLVIEVKGGGIGWDAERNEWYSIDRNQTRYAIKDPAEQARTSRYALFEKLSSLPGWDARWLTVGHAVAFPDIFVRQSILKLDLHQDILLDANSLERAEEKIVSIFRYYAGGRSGGLGYDRLELLERMLVRSFQITTPLGVELAFEDERLVELTERQMLILDFLNTRRRVAIQGCAGSGKTMLAVEKARRLAEQGFEVLLVCFNYALARYLSKVVLDGVSVYHFHGLCRVMANQVGFSMRSASSDQEYFDEMLPNLLLEAVDKLGPQFDAVIVDEGQDIKENWWLPLVSLLRDQEQGILFAFYDDNQNLYHGQGSVPGVIVESPYPLVDNCRNTQRIHRLVASFHHPTGFLRCLGPAGRDPEIHYYSDSQQQSRMLRQIFHRLVYEERIDSMDIVLLTPRGENRSGFKSGTNLGNFTLSDKPTTQRNHIQVSSVHTFKGLESRVVVLAEIDPEASPILDSILYVGCSRARTHLIILVHENMHQILKTRLVE